MMKILFQGDSITDATRDRENGSDLGKGYAFLSAASLSMDRPCEFEFVNRGIAGNKVSDLLNRVQEDIIDVKPDYMSILIGVNDVDVDQYESDYNTIIEQVREAFPDIKIMILEPFVLPGSAIKAPWDVFRSEAEKRAAAAKRVAEKNDLLFVPLMKKFDQAAEVAPAEAWLADGVHPTPMGHEMIKREWLKAFERMI